MAVLMILTYVSFVFRVFIYINLFLKSNLTLHNKALEGIALAPAVFFDMNPTGRIINRLSKDVGSVDGPLQFYLYEALSTLLFVLGSIITSIVIIPYNLVIIPIFSIILYVLIKYVAPIISKLRKIEMVAKGPIFSTINSVLDGLAIIRSSNIEEKFRIEIKKYTNDHYRAYLAFQTLLRFNQFYGDLGASLIIILNVSFIIGLKGYIDPSLAAFSLSTSACLIGMGNQLIKYGSELGISMASTQRLLEYSDIKPEPGYFLPENFKIKKGEIVFSNIFMRYRPSFPYSLSDLSFFIESGQKIGIIGRTGAGKSSILQVLFRLVNPEQGTVYLDGCDYMTIGLQNLRKQLSVIPQSPVLFTASIRDNLDPFHLSTEEEIINALNEVQLKKIVFSNEQGLDNELRGDGISLSAGQQQLLCLARAMIRKNKIIIMDEATANIDNETDRIIQDSIKNLFQGSTFLVIAHRIRTIIHSDKIMVIDAGKCKEFARPLELYKNKQSLFRKMIQHTGPEESQYLANRIKGAQY